MWDAAPATPDNLEVFKKVQIYFHFYK